MNWNLLAIDTKGAHKLGYVRDQRQRKCARARVFGEGIVRVIYQQIGNMNNSLCGPNAYDCNRNRGGRQSCLSVNFAKPVGAL